MDKEFEQKFNLFLEKIKGIYQKYADENGFSKDVFDFQNLERELGPLVLELTKCDGVWHGRLFEGQLMVWHSRGEDCPEKVRARAKDFWPFEHETILDLDSELEKSKDKKFWTVSWNGRNAKPGKPDHELATALDEESHGDSTFFNGEDPFVRISATMGVYYGSELAVQCFCANCSDAWFDAETGWGLDFNYKSFNEFQPKVTV
jgi:hypothetical protein